jgi:P27 family predicted phage terminase small subunit
VEAAVKNKSGIKGKCGPKPKSLVELRAAGSPQARRREHEPQIEALHSAPPCPDGLGQYGRAFWDTHALRLSSSGILTEADLPLYFGLCRQWEKWRESEEKLTSIELSLQTSESGYEQMSGFEMLANRRWSQFAAAAIQFGMSPSSRANVHAALPKKGQVVQGKERFLKNAARSI